MFFLRRRPDLSLEEFIGRYESHHVPGAEQSASGFRYYVRHYLHPTSHVVATDQVVAEIGYDLLVELWFDDRAAYEAHEADLLMRPDAVIAAIAGEEELLDRSASRIAFVDRYESDLGYPEPT